MNAKSGQQRLTILKWLKASGVVVEQKYRFDQPRLLLLPAGRKRRKQPLKEDIEKRRRMEEVKVRRKKSGRPKKAVRKETRAGIRFTQTEYFIIKQKALKAGLRVSAYLRQIAIAGEVKPRLTEEERQFIRQLIGIANNINQLTKMSHQEGLLKVMRYFEEYRQKIDSLIQKLTHD